MPLGVTSKKNSIFTDIVQIGGGRSTPFQKIEKKWFFDKSWRGRGSQNILSKIEAVVFLRTKSFLKCLAHILLAFYGNFHKFFPRNLVGRLITYNWVLGRHTRFCGHGFVCKVKFISIPTKFKVVLSLVWGSESFITF